MRVAISKKIRFEVFKRDSFTCQYCSRKPPKVPLEVDHIIPVCKGGKNNIDNLVTACFDCNRGKSGNELDSIPESLISKSERIKIAKKQYLDFQKVLKEHNEAIQKGVLMVEDIYSNIHVDYCFTESFKISVSNFIEKLGLDIVMNAMKIACSRVFQSNKVLKYFCGICWNEIREKE